MITTLLALEDRLAQGQDFDRLLHPEFFEFGRSGRRWTRTEVLAELSGHGDQPSRTAVSAYQLAPDCWHLSWRSEGTRAAWRSSIWVQTAAGWQMRFHQATPIP
ncbi:hypothetical protein HNQ51_000784 [Inhella inkyongensis]|uniref:DUF4440 domain-containing protein n=1 Tax=Inhella inkyongensis TaxID=392593 RepID=A0A840S4C3_9BURK|nr:DUF4440 domain-containing protein [Inhella inkyongensis]MBB5203491.1 hypothetical protein [Inhella inkyongensis]